MHSERRRGKGRSRILYWFRTPPGVRVGRSALDEDAIRLIEEHNPEVQFDWTRILKGGPEPQPPEPERQPRHRMPRPEGKARVKPGVQPGSDWGQTGVQLKPDSGLTPVEPQSDPGLRAGAEAGLSPVLEEFDPLLAVGDPAMGFEEDEPEPAPSPLETPTAALARLGSEGLSRLRARHAEILARIAERVADPVRRDELKSQADRLNPDTWVTDDEVTTGLEQYESVFESLRATVGRKRRRRKRRGGGGGTQQPEEPSGPSDPDGSV